MLVSLGVFVGGPLPIGAVQAQATKRPTTDDALADMQHQGITGKYTTTFLLASVAERTGGRSLEAKIQLVIINAHDAAEIATVFERLTTWLSRLLLQPR